MKVQINANSWNLSRDTEFVSDTVSTRQFMQDHNVPFDEYKTKEGELKLEYHEDNSVVELPCETIQDVRDICIKYNAKIEIQDETALITFFN